MFLVALRYHGCRKKYSDKMETLFIPVNTRLWSEPLRDLTIHTSIDVTGIY